MHASIRASETVSSAKTTPTSASSTPIKTITIDDEDDENFETLEGIANFISRYRGREGVMVGGRKEGREGRWLGERGDAWMYERTDV